MISLVFIFNELYIYRKYKSHKFDVNTEFYLSKDCKGMFNEKHSPGKGHGKCVEAIAQADHVRRVNRSEAKEGLLF